MGASARSSDQCLTSTFVKYSAIIRALAVVSTAGPAWDTGGRTVSARRKRGRQRKHSGGGGLGLIVGLIRLIVWSAVVMAKLLIASFVLLGKLLIASFVLLGELAVWSSDRLSQGREPLSARPETLTSQGSIRRAPFGQGNAPMHFDPRGPRLVSSSLRFEVLQRDGFRCTYCGRRSPEVVLHIDHVHPWSKGGPTTLDNLRTACADCNLGKGARLLTAERMRLQGDPWLVRGGGLPSG